MNPQQYSDDDELQNVDNPLKVMQPGERVICVVKRHPFGLFSIYATFIFVVIISVAAVLAAPRLLPNLTSQAQAIIALGGLILSALVGLFSYVSSVVYKGNRWIVTSDSITQISQVSLFRKQTSQLSLANLEDVTVEQDGLMPSMIGFGRLRAETAGERSKFVFEFCPNPAYYAKLIIGAHESYIAEKPDEMHTSNRPLANTSAFNQSYGQSQESQQQQPFNPVQPSGQPSAGPSNGSSPQDPTNQ